MNSRMELGRIAGVPIYLDMMFVLVMLVFSYRYFTSGDVQVMSAGLLIIVGVIASILLHELGHAFVARLFKTSTAEIELTGLGGVARFGSSLPRAALPRVAIYAAGPLVNLALYYAFQYLTMMAYLGGKPVAAYVAAELAGINLFLFVFNLLPAYPLDGGLISDAILCKLLGTRWGERVVGALGCIVAALIALWAIQSLPNSIFLLFLAFFLADLNWHRLQSAGGWRR